MDIVEQMKVALTMTDQIVAELRSGGCGDLVVAAALMEAAGAIWRKQFPDEASRRRIVLHGAEVAITGRPR